MPLEEAPSVRLPEQTNNLIEQGPSRRQPAEVGQVELCLPAPGPGTYAIGLYHDENGKKNLDRNFLGIPVEPLGVSNNPGFVFGPPSHADSAFSVGSEGTNLKNVLRY